MATWCVMSTLLMIVWSGWLSTSPSLCQQVPHSGWSSRTSDVWIPTHFWNTCPWWWTEFRWGSSELGEYYANHPEDKSRPTGAKKKISNHNITESRRFKNHQTTLDSGQITYPISHVLKPKRKRKSNITPTTLNKAEDKGNNTFELLPFTEPHRKREKKLERQWKEADEIIDTHYNNNINNNIPNRNEHHNNNINQNENPNNIITNNNNNAIPTLRSVTGRRNRRRIANRRNRNRNRNSLPNNTNNEITTLNNSISNEDSENDINLNLNNQMAENQSNTPLKQRDGALDRVFDHKTCLRQSLPPAKLTPSKSYTNLTLTTYKILCRYFSFLADVSLTCRWHQHITYQNL